MSSKKTPLFVASFTMFLEALARGYLGEEDLAEAVFFFPSTPKGYILQAADPGREPTLGAYFAACPAEGRRVHAILLRALAIAEGRWRAWYHETGAGHLNDFLANNGLNALIRGEPGHAFQRVTRDVVAQMRAGQRIVVGAGVPLIEVGKATGRVNEAGELVHAPAPPSTE